MLVYSWLLVVLIPMTLKDLMYQRVQEYTVVSLKLLGGFYCLIYIIGYKKLFFQGGIKLFAFIVLSILVYYTYPYIQKSIGYIDIEVLLFIGICLPMAEFIFLIVLSMVLLTGIGLVGIIFCKWSKYKKLSYLPFLYVSICLSLVLKMEGL